MSNYSSYKTINMGTHKKLYTILQLQQGTCMCPNIIRLTPTDYGGSVLQGCTPKLDKIHACTRNDLVSLIL